MTQKKIHFIGIGGVHMSGLARMCALVGCDISGSDAKESTTTAELRSEGISVTIGHKAENIDPSMELIVHTSAVKEDNPEMLRARELGLSVVDKATLLGSVMTKYGKRICISGSHGKTTTTAMISETLYGLGCDPTVVNGGVCTRLGTAMRLGRGEYIVAEADEYYDAFLKMRPSHGVILNIEHDHTDFFPTFDRLWQSFRDFALRIDDDGALIVHGGVPRLSALTEGLKCRVVTYGTKNAHWQWADGHAIYHGERAAEMRLAVPGAHNVDNALAAVALCHVLGQNIRAAAAELGLFKGAGRRFQPRGSYNGAAIYDDYAHHPTEVRATLSAAKSVAAGRVICVFQPHTRSRTVELMDDFAASFADADKILLLDIFTPAGREEGHIPITSADLCARLKANGKDAEAPGSFNKTTARLRNLCQEGDTVILMGAGDVNALTI